MLPIIALVILCGSFEGYRFVKQKNFKELIVLLVIAVLSLMIRYISIQPHFPGFAQYIFPMLNITRY
jgi:hypothetical protein